MPRRRPAPAPTPERARREAALAAADAGLAGRPADPGLRFARAELLAGLGRLEEARQAYLELLALDPAHFGALVNLGALLHEAGFRTAARTCFREAVARHPDRALGHLNLANALYEEKELAEARIHFERALALDPADIKAHQGLSFLLWQLGEAEAAAGHRRLGFEGHSVLPRPWWGTGRPREVLQLVSAMGGNVPIGPYLDPARFRVTALYADFHPQGAPVPAHQLIFNAIADADLCGPALDAAERIVAASRAPVLNAPAAVRATDRIGNADRLGRIPDVITPVMADLPRLELEGPGALAALARHGLRPPLLVRAPGFHNGLYFHKVECPEELPAAIRALPGASITAMQFLDARDADGKTRKYRVMLVDGQLYPLHAAVSGHWKIHYVTADMADAPAHRAEDAAFLEDMPAALGPRAMAALARLQEALALDYAGLDFSLDAQGRILLFEANPAMVVYPPEPDDCWAYRRAPVARIAAAIDRMLTRPR